MAERETWHTTFPVCPHCGHDHRDAWEWSADSGVQQCESCDGEFAYERIIDVHWTTVKPTPTPEAPPNAE